MKSAIASVKITAKTKEQFMDQIEIVMNLANWKEHVIGKKIFLKPNCVSPRVVPGQCTSPWVVEGVIRVLKKNTDAEIFLGDSDTATSCQFNKMIKAWGYDKICKRYGVKIVNLSDKKPVKVKVGGKIFREIELNPLLLEVDSIITIPVLKTHVMSVMTGALKNQWGCLTRLRHQYHLNADQCIAEINKFLRIPFVVADATVCMEGMGPCIGEPKLMNYVFAGSDRVAIDSLACDMMKIDKRTVGQLYYGEKLNVGSTYYVVNGDRVVPSKFKPAELNSNFVVSVEMFLRKIPVVSFVVFKTPFFKVPAWIAAKKTDMNYLLKGKYLARRFIRKNPLYLQEFKDIVS